MSEAAGRLPRIALALAVGAVVLALVAVAITVGRDGHAAQVGTSGIAIHEAAAPDLVKLEHAVEWVATGSELSGVVVTDPALERALGLSHGDRIYALAGRQLAREADVADTLARLAALGVTFIDVDLSRPGELVTMRWRIAGDLRSARLGGGSPWRAPDLSDPQLASIVHLDDHHVVLPRATFEALLADPGVLARSARVVPAVTGGLPDGFKLFAIRPQSVLARLGIQNGDQVRAVNGYELTTPDRLLELVTRLRATDQLSLDLDRRGQPEILTITIR